MRINAIITLALVPICLIFTDQAQAQNVDYSMRVQVLRWDDGDNGDQSGGRDPRWKVWGFDNATSGVQGGVCQAQDDIASAPYTYNVPDYTVLNETNTGATTVQVQMKAWEDDCGESCDYESSCGILMEDDNHASQGNCQAPISFRSDPPCQFNTYGYLNHNSDGRWDVEVGIYWEYVSLLPGSISADQTICSGGDPSQLTGDGTESAHVEYQWQFQDNCAGGWTDIGGATLADYDPPSGLTNTRCYRRRVRIPCNTSIDNYSNTITVTVSTLSTDPASISSSVTTLCGSGTVDLSVIGGSLGTGSTWEWYDGDPLTVGVNIGAGTSLTAYPVTATTTFFVRAEGACNTTNSASLTVTVNTSSEAPTSHSSTATTICDGTSIDLSQVGGTLGTGANWVWYDTDPSVGSPASIFTTTSSSYTGVTPAATTTYYVRGEGCDTTIAQSITITDESLSIVPTSINASATTICSGGGPITLDVVGGSLGTGASWEWYDAGCGTSSAGSGVSLVVNPTVTTTYSVRAEGTCNNTVCVSVTITVDQLSTDPTSIATPNVDLCPGETAVLTVSGGSLGDGASWEWYEGSCGGTPAGSGSSISVTPAATTSYFVRAEGTCNTTLCAVITINIGMGASNPDSANVTIDNICPEDTTELVAYLSTPLPAGYIYVWYTGACGAVTVGVGDTLPVTPTVTTTYYVRSVGVCGASACDTVQVNVQNGSVSPVSVATDNNNMCLGDSATLTVVGGSLGPGASWEWYENSCGGTSIGSGSSITVIPTNTATYYVRAEGGSCGDTECASVMISVISVNAILVVPFDTLCVSSSSAFTLSGGFPIGGVYAGTGVAGSVFDPAAAGVGTHTVTYTYTDGNGCIDSASQDLTVELDNVAPTGISSTDTVICDSTDLTLYILGGSLAPGADWVWYENGCGEVQVGTGDSLIASPGVTTTYYARAEGGVCGPSECVSFTVVLSEVSAMLIPFDDICDGTIVNLENGFPDGGVYSGTGVSGGTFNPSSAGTGVHTITYIYTDNYGCADTATADVSVSTNPLTATYEISSEPCAEGGVTITVYPLGGTGFYDYYWLDGTYDNPYHYAPAGIHSVVVTDGSNCTVRLSGIEVTDEMGCVEVPNSFTPNADGMNDTWNLDFSAYNSVSVQVFSKWGQLVFESNNPIVQWDGQYNGTDLPAGTYYYILKLDESVDQNGPLTIVR